VTSDGAGRRSTVLHASAFVAGFALALSLVFASVGLLAAAFGSDDAYFVREHQGTLQQIAGVLLIVLGLNLAGVIRIPFLYRTYSLDAIATTRPAMAGASAAGGTVTVSGGGWRHGWTGVRYAKSVGVGAAFAIGWTPCLGPVLGAILTLSATSADVAQGWYLLLVYALGLGVPFIITGIAVVPVTAFLRRYRALLPWVEIVTGVLIIFVGVLIFLDEATMFNGFFSDLPWLDELNEI
jgi:cytochrome c-type biogenesis protein